MSHGEFDEYVVIDLTLGGTPLQRRGGLQARHIRMTGIPEMIKTLDNHRYCLKVYLSPLLPALLLLPGLILPQPLLPPHVKTVCVQHLIYGYPYPC